jgi:hypothetical protein
MMDRRSALHNFPQYTVTYFFSSIHSSYDFFRHSNFLRNDNSNVNAVYHILTAMGLQNQYNMSVLPVNNWYFQVVHILKYMYKYVYVYNWACRYVRVRIYVLTQYHSANSAYSIMYHKLLEPHFIFVRTSRSGLNHSR